MTCDLNGGPDLVFLESGVSVKIRDLSTRSSRSRYSYAKIQVTKHDGDHIARNAVAWEPVEVRFDSHVQNRYIYPADSLEIGYDEAWLKIYDARKILDRGVLTNHFDEVEVGDVMDYIMSNKDDPYNALTGWEAVTPDLAEQSRQDAEEDIVEAIHGSDADAARGGWRGAVNGALGAAARFVGFMGKSDGMPHNSFKGLEFEDVSPNTAIQQLESMFGFTSWVENDGTLWIGQPEAIPTNRHAVSGLPSDKTYCMKEYNVTEGASPVTMVRLNGETHWFGGNMDGNIWNGGEPADELFPIAEAYIEDPVTGDVADGAVLAPDEPRNIWDLEALEDAAQQILLNQTLDFKNGSIVFNASASTEKDKLAKIDVGDVIMVADFISSHCTNEADGGSYVVHEVQHKVSPRRGWKITCEVGSVPPNIQTSAVYYNASDDDAYSSLKSYRDNRY